MRVKTKSESELICESETSFQTACDRKKWVMTGEFLNFWMIDK